MSSSAAYQVIHDELMLDGNARQNLATFVTTWMEPEVASLMAECLPRSEGSPLRQATLVAARQAALVAVDGHLGDGDGRRP